MEPRTQSDPTARLRTIEAQLLAAGAPFELGTQTVFGSDVRVFKNRPRSLRELVVGARQHASAEYMTFFSSPSDTRSNEDAVRRFTFEQHERLVKLTARALKDDYGVQPGDRVAIAAANCPEWIVSFWATVSLGAICVGLNAWWTGDEIAYAVEHCRPSLLIADGKRLARLSETNTKVSVPTLRVEHDFAPIFASTDTPELPGQPIDEHAPAIMLYTSGTTGRPKGVVHTHGNVTNMLMASFWHGARLQGLCPPQPGPDGGDPLPNSILVTSPLFHVSGLHNAAISALAGGAKTAWLTGRFDPERAIAVIEQERITAWGYTSTLLHRLVHHPAIKDADLTSFRTIGGGGSPLSPTLLKRAVTLFPQCKSTFGIGYGLTEGTAFGTLHVGAELHDDPTSVGRPAPVVDVQIRDSTGQQVPDGTEGDIHLHGPLIMKEYWGDPEATAKAIDAERWLKTGDVGLMRDGRLYIASRKRDMIIRGGENVYPVEIEQRLEGHPAVREAAVVGVDSDEFGQEVKAHVVTAKDVTTDVLSQWVAETLAYYKVPQHWALREEPLPRNATGKILKHALDAPTNNTFIEE